MGASVRGRHPRQRGLVMLTAWVEPAERDIARERAREAGVPLSEWVARAVRRESAAQTADAAWLRLQKAEGSDGR